MTHRRIRRAATAAGTLAGGLVLLGTPAGAAAHGLGGRSDLPIPTWLLAWASVTVVAFTFVTSVLLWTEPSMTRAATGRAVAAARPFVPTVGGLGRFLLTGLFVLAIAAGITGSTDPSENIAAVVLYAVVWVGMQVLAPFVGDAWNTWSPFDTLARLIPGSSAAVDGSDRSLWGSTHWPAAIGIASFAWLELAYHTSASPRVVGWAMLGYTVVMLGSVARFGRGWLRIGEAFSVFFGHIAAMSPFFVADGRIRVRRPLSGLAVLDDRRGLDGVLLIVLGSTTFDGISRTDVWGDLTDNPTGWALTRTSTVVMVATIAAVWGVYALGCAMSARMMGHGFQRSYRAYLPSLVPIALGYSIAHYFSLLFFEGQVLLAQISDPFGQGWDLFGTADRDIDFTIISPTATGWVQAGAIVLGHVGGVIAAHDRALEMYGRAADALRSQYALLIVMLAYTATGLYLLVGS